MKPWLSAHKNPAKLRFLGILGYWLSFEATVTIKKKKKANKHKGKPEKKMRKTFCCF